MNNKKKLKKLADVMCGKKCKAVDYQGNRMLRISDIQKYGILGKEYVSIDNPDVNILQKGDIIIPRTGNNIFPFLIRSSEWDYRCSSYHYIIRPHKLCYALLIYAQLYSESFQSWIESNKKGRNITKDMIEEYELIIIQEEQAYEEIFLLEKQIRNLDKYLRVLKQIEKQTAEKYLFEGSNCTIGDLCFRISCTEPTSCDDGTPVYDIHGICGYTNKMGYEKEVLGIQKHGTALNTIIIPKGAIGDHSLECLAPLIDVKHLKLILENCELEYYLTTGIIPHLHFKNIMNIPCRYDQGFEMKKFDLIDKAIQLQKYQRKYTEMLFYMVINRNFPMNI